MANTDEYRTTVDAAGSFGHAGARNATVIVAAAGGAGVPRLRRTKQGAVESGIEGRAAVTPSATGGGRGGRSTE